MFCVLDTVSSREYFVGDWMYVCLSSHKPFKFKCKLEEVLENGQIVLGNIEIDKGKRGFKHIDGHFKTGVYEVMCVEESSNGRKRHSSLALLYKGSGKHRLVSLDGSSIVQENTEITIKESTEIKDITYRGTYVGINDTDSILLKNVEITGSFTITGSNFMLNDEECMIQITDSIEIVGIGKVRIS